MQLQAGKTGLTEFESLSNFWKIAGFPLPQHKLVSKKTDLEQALENFKFPLVMKIMSPDIQHKTDCGGVKAEILTVCRKQKKPGMRS